MSFLFCFIGNRINLKGSDISSGIGKSRNNTIGGILTSPFFPSRYPRDLGMEYVITCPTEAPSCRVRVLFSDFQLAAVSIIEVYENFLIFKNNKNKNKQSLFHSSTIGMDNDLM